VEVDHDHAVEIRTAVPSDYERIVAVVDEWWGGRPMRPLLPRLFLDHFAATSLVAEDGGRLVGFLVGFLSPSRPDEAYIHFVGVRPDCRSGGLARAFYERFFDRARAEGRTVVRCVTSPVNEGSVAFHRKLGFEDELVEGYDGPGADRVAFLKRL
jgi:ribosomal protein S18 acetylase RimI-like enzyme